ncbi:MAG: hypothetical protein KDD56_00185 [Bdellovibrionales bacterium]|nr:hypothetical protein [Bdellovibrionales bacterium]
MGNFAWLGFCVSSPVTKTFVHFFPSSGGIGAPYNVTCNLTLFGSDIGKKTVKIDGLKIAQPDGIRIDDVFPHFEKSETNIAGLKIELSTHQPRIDLSTSICLIELVTQNGSTKFKAKNLADLLEPRKSTAAGALISDEKFSSSLIAVNADRDSFTPNLFTINYSQTENSFSPDQSQESTFETLRKNISIPELAPLSVQEISVNGDFFTDQTALNLSWGKSNVGGVYLDPEEEQETAIFALYREANTKRPVSVLAL